MTVPAPQTHRTALAALLWLAVYLLAVTVPLFALLPGSAPGLGFAWDFSMALGYAGLAMLGVQFALTARFRRATAPFGIDIVYYFHRYLAVFALAVIAGHYAMLRVMHPDALGAADPASAPGHMTAGRVALVLFALVVGIALLRSRVQFEYDRWRLAHAVLATVAFGLALWHLHGTERYLDTAWKQWLWGVYGAFWVALILYVRIARPAHATAHPWTVVEVRPERGQVTTLALEPRSGPPLRFAPGQFAWLTLRASPFAMREHPFSIASSAERGQRIELSIKALGDFTEAIQDIKAGEAAWIDAPYGTFSIERRARRGGVCVRRRRHRHRADHVDAAHARRPRRRRPLVLFYGNRVLDASRSARNSTRCGRG